MVGRMAASWVAVAMARGMRGTTRAMGPAGGRGGALPTELERDARSRFDVTPRSSGFTRLPLQAPTKVLRSSVPQSDGMDEATSRALPPTRRMASAKPASTVRGRSGAGSSSGPGKGDGEEISRARWAGVALVIAALLGAISLAVFSRGDGTAPREPGTTTSSATPTPAATVLDTRLPVAQPEITSPKTGWIIGEWYVDVAVAIPDEPLPKRLLSIVILRDGTEVKSLERPDPGRAVNVPEVPLAAGENVLTAALRGPGGLGPISEPVTVTQDRDAPVLRITAPKTGAETFESAITVTGTSEPGASVKVENAANQWDGDIGVGPSGDFEVSVPLAMGRNRIGVSSTDAAGMEQRDAILVVRKDGRPVIKITAPRQVARSELPKLIRVIVDATDADGAALQDATVSYTLGGPGWTAQDFEDQTDADGRSSWEVELVAGTSGGDPTLGVEVIAANGERNQASRVIDIP
jgi:hypothetical protein